MFRAMVPGGTEKEAPQLSVLAGLLQLRSHGRGYTSEAFQVDDLFRPCAGNRNSVGAGVRSSDGAAVSGR